MMQRLLSRRADATYGLDGFESTQDFFDGAPLSSKNKMAHLLVLVVAALLLSSVAAVALSPVIEPRRS